MVIALNLQIAFGRMAIFSIFSLLTHKCGRSYGIFINLFICYLNYFCCRCLVSFIRLIYKYLFLYEAIKNGIIPLISFLIYLPLAIGIQEGYWFLQVPCHFAKSVYQLSQGFVLEWSFRNLKYKILSSANTDILTFYFSLCISFIFFCCLIALTKLQVLY